MDSHARGCTFQQMLPELVADFVVAQNVELNEHVVAGTLDAGEDRRERRVAVDEQLRVVAVVNGSLASRSNDSLRA